MDKDSGREARPEGTKWNEERTAYRCADGVDVMISKKVFRLRQRDSEKARDQIVCANGVEYNTDTRKKQVRLFVSGTEFNRPMLQIVKSMKDVRTIIFPSTIK